MMEFYKRKITKDESRDTGMAVVLLLLILFIRTRRDGILWAAVALHALNMMVPRIFASVAVLWLGLSHLLGTVMSKILLSVLFFGIVTPIGVLRRLLGRDSLQLHTFKASEESVMSSRNHVFVGRDIEKPY
jgi:saxitoxin biosynthesis operon SxtJ-like protein